MHYKHMYLNVAASCIALFGFFVIYSNKIALNKQHFTSLHGKAGAVIFVGIAIQSICSYFKLYPSQSAAKRLPYRKYHIWFGKSLFVAALMESSYGMYVVGKYRTFYFALAVSTLYIFSLVFNVKRIRKTMAMEICVEAAKLFDVSSSFECDTNHAI